MGQLKILIIRGLLMFWKVILFMFITLCIMGVIAKPGSIYKGHPEEQNPMEGKNIKFVFCDSDNVNAEGVRGHLEVTGESSRERKGFYESAVKRLLDIFVPFIVFLLLLPVYVAVPVAILIEDPGPVVFTQKRVGRNKRYFKMHKFRTMKTSTPHDVPTYMLDDPDQYITKVGRFLRAHSLDELPQGWDIFIGNMSVVGPRPVVWKEERLIAERDRYRANDVKPGLTGIAQLSGRDELGIEEKAKLDGEYVKNISFTVDNRCFWKTLHVIKEDDTIVEGRNRDGKKRNDR